MCVCVYTENERNENSMVTFVLSNKFKVCNKREPCTMLLECWLVLLVFVHHQRKGTGALVRRAYNNSDNKKLAKKWKQSTWIENNWCAMHECDDQWSWFVTVCLRAYVIVVHFTCNFSVSHSLDLSTLFVRSFIQVPHSFVGTHTWLIDPISFELLPPIIRWVQVYSCRQQ